MLNKIAVSKFWLDVFGKGMGLREGLLPLQYLLTLKGALGLLIPNKHNLNTIGNIHWFEFNCLEKISLLFLNCVCLIWIASVVFVAIYLLILNRITSFKIFNNISSYYNVVQPMILLICPFENLYAHSFFHLIETPLKLFLKVSPSYS